MSGDLAFGSFPLHNKSPADRGGGRAARLGGGDWGLGRPSVPNAAAVFRARAPWPGPPASALARRGDRLLEILELDRARQQRVADHEGRRAVEIELMGQVVIVLQDRVDVRALGLLLDLDRVE